MISITRTQVPTYLTNGDFYNALCPEDKETFAVPSANLKLTPHIDGVADVAHLLRTLQYWGVLDLPDELTTFLICEHSLSDYKKLRLLLKSFTPHPNLLDWFTSLRTLRKHDFQSESSLQVAVRVLIEHLTSPNNIVSSEAHAVLVDAVKQNLAPATNGVVSHMPCFIKQLSNSANVSHERSIVSLCACVYGNWICPPGLVPHLLRLLCQDDEETVENACRILLHIMDDGMTYERILLSFKVLERFVKLLNSANTYIQGAALRAVRYFVRASSNWGHCAIAVGAVTNLNEILCHPKQHQDILRGTITTLACVVSTMPLSLPVVIDSGALEQVIKLHRAGALQNCLLEEDWLWFTVLDAADGYYLRYLAHLGLVSVLCDILRSGTAPDNVSGYTQNVHTFVTRCELVQDLFPVVVAEIVQCGGKETLQAIAAQKRHEGAHLARSTLDRCFPVTRLSNFVIISIVLCSVVLLLVWYVVYSVQYRCDYLHVFKEDDLNGISCIVGNQGVKICKLSSKLFNNQK